MKQQTYMNYCCAKKNYTKYKQGQLVEKLFSASFCLSNVKTVKEQMFHKRSRNLLIYNRNETKMIEFFPEFVLLNVVLSIWPRRADSGPNPNDLFSIREIRDRYQNVLVSFPKRYRNVCSLVFDITSC
jgi:hypothetical protein